MKKNFKLVLALVLAAMMIASMIPAMAAPDAIPTPGTGKITVNNAVKGAKYNIYKLFDAEVGANGAIIYKSTAAIPDGLTAYFTKDSETNIVTATDAAKDGDKLSAGAAAALKTWAATATKAKDEVQASGNTVEFTALDFGYYVITSDAKAEPTAIMVTSTDPNGEVYEKNEAIPQPEKTVDDHTYSIGDTITYTVSFPGINYKGTGVDAEVVTTYTVTDTLPAFLSNVTVTSITIGGTTMTVNETNFPGVTTFGTNKTFNIPWANKVFGTKEIDDQENEGQKKTVTDQEKWTWVSKYTNGSEVVITYTAVLTDVVNVGDKKNINTITVTRKTGKNNEDEQPTDEHWEDDEYVYTYGAAIEKVDENKKPLAGAEFVIDGLTAVETAEGSGVYTVTKYDPATVTTPTTLKVNADGMIYIVGLQEALTLNITETKAPTGYNKLTGSQQLTTQQIGDKKLVKKITGYRQYDAKGNLIEESVSEITGEGVEHSDADLSALTAAKLQITNNKGTQLPETGGIGTTIFYIGGSVLVLAAAILLITKRRMSNND